MSLTGHKEIYRDYCVCCLNYCIVHLYYNGDYYCSGCKAKITKRLKQSKIDPDHITDAEERERMIAFIDEVVRAIQEEMPQGKKVTKQDYLISIKKWRPKRKRRKEA